MVTNDVRRDDAIATRFRRRLAARADELGPMRRALNAWLAEADVEPGAAGDVAIACSEACANSVEHAYTTAPGHGTLDLGATLAVDGGLRIVLRDLGRWRSDGPRLDRGRGLALMRALMDGVEVATGPRGTVVRMRRQLATTGGR